jgi:hypothetical protein
VPSVQGAQGAQGAHVHCLSELEWATKVKWLKWIRLIV